MNNTGRLRDTLRRAIAQDGRNLLAP
jgi:hypothetical protein